MVDKEFNLCLNSIMKIQIAGYGFVGKAQELILKDYYDVVVYDPELGYNKWHNDADAHIICVSTPPRPDGSCEMANVFNVCELIDDSKPILIKSTISVEGWEALSDTYPSQLVCFSPEFLRQAHWQDDAKNQKVVYLGGNCVNFWSEVFITALGEIGIAVEEPRALVAAKAFRNAFLATKVTFFNQVYDYCKAYGLDYTDVQHFISADERIGHSHTQVTEERGFGGHCFPKDMRAIKKSAQRNNVRLTLIEEALEYNNTIRKS